MAETVAERIQDLVLASLFLVIAVVALVKCRRVIVLEGAEAAIKAFYFLIFGAAALRSIWFFIPSDVLEPSYAPAEVWAFRTPNWAGTLISEILLAGGSLCLFAIFVLIIIYWADLLKKVFKPVRKQEPMTSFLTIMASLAGFEVCNFALFAAGIYSSQVMILLDSLLLALLSVVCVVEISVFSHRFRTVLTTLGAINQVPTDSQVRTIVWITVFGNAFFVARAAVELFLAATFIALWKENKPLTSLANGRSHFWDIYVLVKHTSELAILFLMLYTLQSRRAPGHSHSGASHHGASHPHHHHPHAHGAMGASMSGGVGSGYGSTGTVGGGSSLAAGGKGGSGGSGGGGVLPNRSMYTEVKDLEAVSIQGNGGGLFSSGAEGAAAGGGSGGSKGKGRGSGSNGGGGRIK